jgi:hypothetical protein
MSRSRVWTGWLMACAAMTGAACSDGDETPSGQIDGTIELRTAPIDLAPGQSGQWLQWVAGPADVERDVVAVAGSQSAGGHHGQLRAVKTAAAVGTTRPWVNADQLDGTVIGFVGGEGAAANGAPDGYVYRIPAGYSLAVQTHYLNAGDTPIVGETTFQVTMTAADPANRVASAFTLTPANVVVGPAPTTTLDVSCKLQHDLPLLVWANHMHEHGKSQRTTVTDAAGVTTDFKVDPVWNPEWAMAMPNYSVAPPGQPLVLAAGTTLDTHCTWGPTGGREVRFPDEMCVFLAVFDGPRDIACVDGFWFDGAGK